MVRMMSSLAPVGVEIKPAESQVFTAAQVRGACCYLPMWTHPEETLTHVFFREDKAVGVSSLETSPTPGQMGVNQAKDCLSFRGRIRTSPTQRLVFLEPVPLFVKPFLIRLWHIS